MQSLDWLARVSSLIALAIGIYLLVQFNQLDAELTGTTWRLEQEYRSHFIQERLQYRSMNPSAAQENSGASKATPQDAQGPASSPVAPVASTAASAGPGAPEAPPGSPAPAPASAGAPAPSTH